MRAFGANLVEHGEDFQAALEYSRGLATERGLHPVPSFHPDLVAGNAVSALTFLQNAPTLERVYVPIGLGSGICAMLAARDALKLDLIDSERRDRELTVIAAIVAGGALWKVFHSIRRVVWLFLGGLLASTILLALT